MLWQLSQLLSALSPNIPNKPSLPSQHSLAWPGWLHLLSVFNELLPLRRGEKRKTIPTPNNCGAKTQESKSQTSHYFNTTVTSHNLYLDLEKIETVDSQGIINNHQRVVCSLMPPHGWAASLGWCRMWLTKDIIVSGVSWSVSITAM